MIPLDTDWQRVDRRQAMRPPWTPRVAITALILSILVLSMLASPVEAQWGHLRGRFLYDGEPPGVNSKNSNNRLRDESLIVNRNNRGLANVIVYVSSDKPQALREHPCYAAQAGANVTLTMDGGRFTPHVLLLRTTQTLVTVNKDTQRHHAFIQFVRNSPM